MLVPGPVRVAPFALSIALAVGAAAAAATSPPTGTGIDVHGGSRATPEAEILVHLSATDDVAVTGVHVSQSPVQPPPGEFLPVTAAAAWEGDVAYTITGGYGDVTIYARFVDGEGNVSSPLAYDLAYLDKMSVVVSTILRGSYNADAGTEVATDPAGNVYLGGYRFSNPLVGGGDRGYVARFDPSGTNLWERSVSSSGGVGTGLTQILDVAVDGAGTSYSTGLDLVDVQGDTSYYDAFLVKYDAAGVHHWTEPLSSGTPRTIGSGVALGRSGHPYVVGRTDGALPGQTSAGGNDAFLAEYDTSGNRLRIVQFGTAASDAAQDVAIDEDGFLYVVGSTAGPLFGETNLGSGADLFLSKLDADGNHQWTRLMGTERSPESAYAVELRGPYVYVVGSAKDTCSCATTDLFVAQYTRTGGEKWTRIFGGHVFNSSEEGIGLAVDRQGSAYVVGRTFDDLDGNVHLGEWDLFVSKYGPTGERLLTFSYSTVRSDRGFGAAIAPDGRVLVTGAVGDELHGEVPAGSEDILLLVLDFSATGVPADVMADGFETGDLSSWSTP